jgi:ATP-dependent Clp protease adaptor protein ClpS
MVKEKLNPVKQNKKSRSEIRDLILFNDEINTFDFVIETLIEVCGHDVVQAEQCALIAHFKGKCTVKSGPVSELKPMMNEMSQRELTVSIS